MVPDKHELQGRCAQEKKRGDDRDCESSGVELACKSKVYRVRDIALGSFAEPFATETTILVRRSSAEGSVDSAFARVRAVAGHDGDCNHAAGEEDVEDDGEECQEGNAAEAACQADREDEVNDGGSRDAFNGFLPCWDVNVAVC